MKIVGEKHYIIDAMRNSSVALGAAMELLANRGSNTDGIQELVMIINTASIQLRNRCKSCADRSEKIT